MLVGGHRFFGLLGSKLSKTIWVAAVVESGDFTDVSCGPFSNVGIDMRYFAEEASDFLVLYVIFSYLVPAISENLFDGAVMESGEFVEVLSGYSRIRSRIVGH